MVDHLADEGHGEARRQRANGIKRADPRQANVQIDNEVIDKDRDRVGLAGAAEDHSQGGHNGDDPAIVDGRILDECAPACQSVGIGHGSIGSEHDDFWVPPKNKA